MNDANGKGNSMQDHCSLLLLRSKTSQHQGLPWEQLASRIISIMFGTLDKRTGFGENMTRGEQSIARRRKRESRHRRYGSRRLFAVCRSASSDRSRTRLRGRCREWIEREERLRARCCALGPLIEVSVPFVLSRSCQYIFSST
jgi:hypothetical protein